MSEQELPLTPMIFQLKWYDAKAKEFKEIYTRKLQQALTHATEAFESGSKNFIIVKIEID